MTDVRQVAQSGVRLVLAALCGLALHGFLGGSPRTVLDAFHTWSLPAPPDGGGRLPQPVFPLDRSRVVLVDVSVPGSGERPVVSRTELARLIEKLTALDTWVIGLDVLLEKPGDPGESTRLEKAIRDSGRVVLATRYASPGPHEIRSPFASAASASGMSNLPMDEDGSFRSVQHFYEMPGIVTRHSLGLELLRRALPFPDRIPARVHVGRDEIRVGDPGEPYSITLPLDEEGLSPIPYLGPAGSLPILNHQEVLDSTPESLSMTGKVVLLGDASAGSVDSKRTPFHRVLSSQISSVEIHGQVVMGGLTGRRQRPAPRWSQRLLAVGAGVVGAALPRLMPPLLAVLLQVGGIVGLWLACGMAFVTSGTFQDPLVPSAALLAGLVIASLSLPARGQPSPRVPGESLRMARVLLRSGKPAEALAVLEKHLPEDGSPLLPELAGALALAALHAGQTTRARVYVSVAPPSALGDDDLLELATLFEEKGELDLAATSLQTLQVRDPARAPSLAPRIDDLRQREKTVPRSLREALRERYTDWSYVGRGGMARVYRARDRQIGRDVAVKVPQEVLLSDRSVVQRFLREMEMLTKLTHPNIVKLHDLGRDEPLYFTMEFVTGRSLRTVIEKERELPLERVLALLLPIADALASCHAAGVVHRDVKPDNILLADEGRVLLSDFGLAFLQDETRMTALSVRVGTPMYMAPEQLDGDAPTPAVDVYACGLILHEALAGKHPLRHQPLHVRALRAPPPLPDSVAGRAASELVAACLSIDPAARPADGAELRSRLERLVKHA